MTHNATYPYDIAPADSSSIEDSLSDLPYTPDEFHLLSFPISGSGEWTTLLRKDCFITSEPGSVACRSVRRMASLGAAATFVLLTLVSLGLTSMMSIEGAPALQNALEAQPAEAGRG